MANDFERQLRELSAENEQLRRELAERRTQIDASRTRGRAAAPPASDPARELELKASHIVDNIPALVGISTPATGVEFVNRQIEDYTGLTAEELAHWRTSNIIHPEDMPRMRQAIADAYSTGGSFDFEHR